MPMTSRTYGRTLGRSSMVTFRSLVVRLSKLATPLRVRKTCASTRTRSQIQRWHVGDHHRQRPPAAVDGGVDLGGQSTTGARPIP